MTRFGYFLLLLAVLGGCQDKLFHHTDPAHKVSVSYPGNLSLLADPESLQRVVNADEQDTIDRTELLFVVASPGRSRLSCSVHTLPEGTNLTADEYYKLSTSQEIEQLGGVVVEEKSEVLLDGRVFHRVGFILKVDELNELHIRIYQHLDISTGKVLVLTSMVDADASADEARLMEGVVHSLRLGW